MLSNSIAKKRSAFSYHTRPEPEILRCRFMAQALYTRRGCRDIHEITVEVTEISRHFVKIHSKLAFFLPDNFTLILGTRQYGLGCSVLTRDGVILRCNLIRRETTAMVGFLSKVTDPRETVREIRHPLFPKGRMRYLSQ